MAEMKILKCPNCNAALEIENGLDTFYCKYCGYKILLNGQSKAAYRAKTRIKEMEHDERMADMLMWPGRDCMHSMVLILN